MKRLPKILLVDDDLDFIEATRTVLESKPYQVVVAHEGDEGLKKAMTEKPDLILLDVIMPLKDGFTVAEQLKKDPQLNKIPVVMLTSFAQRKGESRVSQAQGMMLDAEDYIDKPVAPQELLSRIDALIRRAKT
ncbi:MAG: response regulator [Chloroflexi bacterium]|nr:response regulator [Chloroflexota bacterium]